MGNQACCTGMMEDPANTCTASDLGGMEAQPALAPDYQATAARQAAATMPLGKELGLPAVNDNTYKVKLDKRGGQKLGLDVDYMEGRSILPIMGITGGLAESWNKMNPHMPLQKGDSCVAVNGGRGNVSLMLEKCKHEDMLELTLRTDLTYEHLVADIEKLVTTKMCGPILIRLSWHDSGSFSSGRFSGGCPNAAMRFTGGGESKFGNNAGLPDVAVPLLSNISAKYCPDLISNADLWALAANVSVRLMGGPDIATRFGRVDAKSSAESVASQEGRLPDGDKGEAHLRWIFSAKGFSDKDIVALSGAHCVGHCHADRSGFVGAWTTEPYKFDNSYFKNLLQRTYTPEKSSMGKPQYGCPVTKTMMLESDIALIRDPSFKRFVETYAADQDAFFADFTEAWVRMQELGWTSLRDIL